jgi:hypothetical protein
VTRPADQLEQFKFSAKSLPEDSAKIISVGPQNAGEALNEIINENNPFRPGQKVLSAKERLLDHNLKRQSFSLRFLSLIVLPGTFLVGVVVPDEKIKTSCFGMVSLIVGALIQESGNQRNPKIEEDDAE